MYHRFANKVGPLEKSFLNRRTKMSTNHNVELKPPGRHYLLIRITFFHEGCRLRI